MHNGTATRLLILSLLAAPFGCASEDPVDLGHEVTGSALSDYEGNWDGYAEAYEFDDGSDRVRLTLAADGTGELTVGDSAELPPPGADLGYPPGATEPKVPSAGSLVFAGFAYPVLDGTVENSRIRMHSTSGEVYREWCDLQTPNYAIDSAPPGSYACLPSSGWSSDGKGHCFVWVGHSEPIECGLLSCLVRCECTQDDCGVAQALQVEDIEIDAALEGGGDRFVGTMVLGKERITVRLTRQ